MLSLFPDNVFLVQWLFHFDKLFWWLLHAMHSGISSDSKENITGSVCLCVGMHLWSQWWLCKLQNVYVFCMHLISWSPDISRPPAVQGGHAHQTVPPPHPHDVRGIQSICRILPGWGHSCLSHMTCIVMHCKVTWHDQGKAMLWNSILCGHNSHMVFLFMHQK